LQWLIAIALYEPMKDRPLATRFCQDARVSMLTFRSLALWLLGYPEAALADSDRALKDARQIGQAATLMYALALASAIHIYCGNYAAVTAQAQELIALAEEKGAFRWKARGMMNQGCVFALTGKASDAVQLITSVIAAYRSTGSTIWIPFYLSHLARAFIGPRQFDDAVRSIGEALTVVETTKERLCEAEVHRTAGEIALMAPEPQEPKAEGYFERALAVARQQQAKS
jgi:predicted ATPase